MRRLLLLVPFLLVAACEDKAAPPTEQGGQASGQILAGSVSDAMIPLGELKSEAPLAPRQAPEATATGLDEEQPEVVPVEGVDGTAPPPAPAPAAPAPAPTG
ncbi:MAG: hypothetical protein ACKO01_10435 [Erythrobacter sp.]